MEPQGIAPGVLRGMAFRSQNGDAMREVQTCRIEPGRGMTSENRKPGQRELTLLSVQSWRDACRELGAELPWHTRRANLLIDGIDLPATIGCTLCIGEARILVHGETRPCGLMDQQHPGLRQALVPQVRGGVHGEVLGGGILSLGDRIRVLPRDA